ncbi:hypothetical protein KSP40_PGU017206 [Platanthera guangdongensis]|uniref:Uncharacterized protein n=1 Tax=Platanthera guangdongensis TaxID=2320717 RepID=A0ABR2MMB6_9ASPA
MLPLLVESPVGTGWECQGCGGIRHYPNPVVCGDHEFRAMEAESRISKWGGTAESTCGSSKEAHIEKSSHRDNPIVHVADLRKAHCVFPPCVRSDCSLDAMRDRRLMSKYRRRGIRRP